MKNIDKFLCLEKIRFENTDQFFTKKSDLKNPNKFLVFIKEFLLTIADFET